MRLIRLRRDEKGHAALLEAALVRIERMCLRYNGDPVKLANMVWALHSQNSPALGLWVAVDDDGQVIGHVLASVQSWDYKMVGWVHQTEGDRPVTKDFRDETLAALDGWAAEWNAASPDPAAHVTLLKMATGRDAEAWLRHAGFRLDRTILERAVRR